MHIDIIPIPAFRDNYIWAIVQEDTCCLVDPGDANAALRFLSDHDLSLNTILITHHHADHTGGVAGLRDKFPDARVFGPHNSPFAGLTDTVAHGDTLELPGPLSLQVIAVPGHTLDHIAYYCTSAEVSGHPLLFCGDTLFAAGCGRIFEGDAQIMYDSLQRLAALPAQTHVYCAHEYTLANLQFAIRADSGNEDLLQRLQQCQDVRQKGRPTLPSTIGIELRTNPFLRCHIDSLRQSAAQQSGCSPQTPVEVFAALREWKNNA